MENLNFFINEIEKLKLEDNYSEAIFKLEEAIANYENNYTLYEELADIYLYLGDLKKAEKAVDYSLSLFKTSATWNYLKWFIQLWKNKFHQAIIYLEKSNKISPNNPEVMRNLWWAYFMKWETIKWVWILKRALNISPEDILILEDLAMALIWVWEINEWNKILTKIKK